MSRHDFFPDEDTTLSAYTYEAGSAAVMFSIEDGAEVRFEGDKDVLIGLFQRALVELTGTPVYVNGQDVAANGRNPDAQDPRIAAIADHTQKAIAMLEQAIASLDDKPAEEMRTPEMMMRGGWFRTPPSQVWHQLTGCTFDRVNGKANVWVAGKDTPLYLRIDTTYPYMTDEAFQASCDKENAR